MAPLFSSFFDRPGVSALEERRRFVQGFSHLMGRDGVLRKFTLTSLELTKAVYPRAHTCFNRIDVPLYRTKEELVAGFEFVLELGDQTFTMD